MAFKNAKQRKAVMAKMKKGKTIDNVNYLNPADHRNDWRKDKQLKALHPGKRISKNGNVYYEYRRNRADLNRKKRL